MNRRHLLGAALLGMGSALADDGLTLDSMDAASFRGLSEKVRVEAAEGKTGAALRFSFADECRSTFAAGRIRGGPAWDSAAGFSFWVKGDGSDRCGGLELIWNEDFALRYDYAFPINSTEWRKVTVAWRDLVPVLPAPGSRAIDPKSGNAPSKFSAFWVGKWWYWDDYRAHSYAIDDIRLEREIPLDTRDYRPTGSPHARVREKLRAAKPVTVVTMGDSLTSAKHWANRTVRWPELLKAKLSAGSVVVNPAIGGTQLRQNLVLMPTWLQNTPEPDLVTVWFGGNDWEAGMRGPMFYETVVDAIDRIRRATHGKADVLILTTAPSADQWDTRSELIDAARRAAKDRNAGLADTYAAFHDAGKTDRARLYVNDRVHLSPIGHELAADTVLSLIGHG